MEFKSKKNCWLINAIHLLYSWSRDSFIALLKRIEINHFRLLIQHASRNITTEQKLNKYDFSKIVFL